jgi:hypothetical protein
MSEARPSGSEGEMVQWTISSGERREPQASGQDGGGRL